MQLPDEVVLYSSGWESTGCALQTPCHVPLCFVDYGQRYYCQECRRAERFAIALGRELVRLELSSLRMLGRGRESGDVSIVVPDRNLLMLRLVAECGAKRVWIGTKNVHPLLDPYGDSNRKTLRDEGQRLGVEVVCPYTCWPKCLVKWQVRRRLADRLVFCSENLIP
jgi:hypothetical protein